MSGRRQDRVLKIGAARWTVRWKKIKGITTGEAHLVNHTITVDPRQSPDSAQDSLLHEALHALFQFLNFPQDEDIVHRLTPALLMMLRDNPWLVEEITA